FGLKNRNTTIGATVSMNLFAGGSDRARVRAAEAERIGLELQIEDKQQQIENEVRQAWRSLNTAEQRYRSETVALQQTSESLRIKALRHAQGLEKTSDLLDAQVRLDTSRVARIRARYDVMIAKAALLLAAGTLNEEVVQ
ncbi:MAG: TolC family protein, partial [Mariprofundaceae bacterium]